MLTPIVATVTLTTAAPRAAVWQALEAAPRWPQVLTDLAEAAIAPAGRLEAGAVVTTKALPGRNVIDMSYRVLAVEPLRRLVMASSARGFRAETEYVLDDDEEAGTQVTITARVMPERVLGRLGVALWRNQQLRPGKSANGPALTGFLAATASPIPDREAPGKRADCA
jgi:uncharacterized protein YndB with AHSA1/START domain